MATLEPILLLGFQDGATGLAARLLPLGYRAIRLTRPEEVTAQLDEDKSLRGGLVHVGGGRPAREVLAAQGKQVAEGWILVGPAPAPEERVAWRAAGLRHVLVEPYDEHELRFLLNLASHDPEQFEGRREPRVPGTLTVRVFSGTGQRAAVLYNISRGGAYLETPRPTMAGGKVRLQIPLPDGPLELTAEVVTNNVPGNLQRRRMPVGMGLRFADLDDAGREALDRYVRDRLRRYEL